jgi:hypothetical protein
MKLIAFLFIIIPSLITAETYINSISGYVTDAKTDEPLENVNVYISNTTFGAATDRDGYYIIKSVPPGNHELIISMIGYNYISEIIVLKADSELKYSFKLNQYIFETSATEVVADVPHEWLNNLKIFKKYFLGQNAFADDCEIENEEILEFNWTNSYTLVASAKSPLMIRNDALGYQIRCILAFFSLDTKHEKWSWAVKPEFKPLSTTDADVIESCNENRKRAFFGSLTHFLLSLSRKNLHNDLFCAYFVDRPGRRSARRESVRMSEPYENLFFYGETPHQYILNFKDCLCIVYNMTDISWLQLKLDEVIIDKFGYPQTTNSFEVYGQWLTRGVANSLPFYFVPDPE